MDELKTLIFMNSDNAQLDPTCEEDLFRSVEWKVQPYQSGATYVDKRLVEAIVEEKDAVAYGGTLFYGHVLISQERTVGPDGTVIGTSTSIVPMDDAKLKKMDGRSGYYGTGIHKMGVCPAD